jgi:hypothetical protein
MKNARFVLLAAESSGCLLGIPEDVMGLTVTAARKRHFLRHLYIKCIILPRQARDEHRENSKKSGVFEWVPFVCPEPVSVK